MPLSPEELLIERTASEAVVKERLRAREGAPDEGSDAQVEDYEMLQARYQAPDAREEACHIRIGERPTLEEAATEALEGLIRLQVA